MRENSFLSDSPISLLLTIGLHLHDIQGFLHAGTRLHQHVNNPPPEFYFFIYLFFIDKTSLCQIAHAGKKRAGE